MSVHTEIVARLEADAGVGAVAGDRIYVQRLPQNPTYPAVVWRQVSGPRITNLGGAAGRARTRLQIDSIAETWLEASALAAAVRGSLHGFTGTLATLHAAIALENELDDPSDETERAGLYRIVQDYRINHAEA